MMNYLKKYLISQGILFIMTYADENAIDFFKKNGFDTHIQFKQLEFQYFMMSYKGSKEMQCILNYDFDPLTFKSEIQKEIKNINIKL